MDTHLPIEREDVDRSSYTALWRNGRLPISHLGEALQFVTEVNGGHHETENSTKDWMAEGIAGYVSRRCPDYDLFG